MSTKDDETLGDHLSSTEKRLEAFKEIHSRIQAS